MSNIPRTSRNIMRAIRVHTFGGVENLKLENVPVPTPSKNEVLIKVGAVGVNPVETYIRAGTFNFLPKLPYTPGGDAAGVVEEVGSEVTKFKKGDRVFVLHSASGAYAEYATAESRLTGHLCERLSFAQGAAIGIPYFTAATAIHLKGQVKPGETMLIHGASGAVGLAAIQVGKAHGVRVVGTAGTTQGMELVKDMGADLVFNHREKGYLEDMREAIGEPDVILEMLSNVNLQKDMELIKPKGRILVIGCRGTVEINPQLLMTKSILVSGFNILATSLDESEFNMISCLLQAGQRLGWLDPKVHREYPLGQAAAAHHDIIHNQGTFGKLVLDATK